MNVYTICMIKTINATKFRNNFKDTMDHVKNSKKPLVITERDIPSAVLIDIDEYEDLLSGKDKEFLISIKNARAQYTKGQVFDMTDVFADIV